MTSAKAVEDMASTATRAIEGEMRLRDEVARLENELRDVRRELDHAVEEASMSAKTAADADAAAAAERERQRAAVAARLEEETTRADAAEADAKRWKLLADAREREISKLASELETAATVAAAAAAAAADATDDVVGVYLTGIGDLRDELRAMKRRYAHDVDAAKVRSIAHWSPYDRVGVVNADP
jgi:hypothetical protein